MAKSRSRMRERWNSFMLPQTTRIIGQSTKIVDNPSREMHKPPFVVNANIDPRDGYKDLKKMMRSIECSRKISARTVEYLGLLKNMIREHSGLRTNQKRKRELEEKVEIHGLYMQRRVDDIYGDEGMCQKVLDFENEVKRTRLLTTFGDLLAANLSELKMRNGEFWKKFSWKERGSGWQDIAVMIKAERSQLGIYGIVISAEGRTKKGILAELREAADELGWKASQLEWTITTYAERNAECHLGITKKAENAEFEEVAMDLGHLRKNMKAWLVDEEERMNAMDNLDVYAKTWFDNIFYRPFDENGKTPLFELSRRGLLAKRSRLEREEVLLIGRVGLSV